MCPSAGTSGAESSLKQYRIHGRVNVREVLVGAKESDAGTGTTNSVSTDARLSRVAASITLEGNSVLILLLILPYSILQFTSFKVHRYHVVDLGIFFANFMSRDPY